MSFNQEIVDILTNKFWDFPSKVDEMRIPSYDASGNPLVIDFYFSGSLRFTHILEYDVDGNLTKKQLIRR